MVTSDFRPEVEIRPFRACSVHPAIIIGTVRLLWTWLWGRYHVPQNAVLVLRVFVSLVVSRRLQLIASCAKWSVMCRVTCSMLLSIRQCHVAVNHILCILDIKPINCSIWNVCIASALIAALLIYALRSCVGRSKVRETRSGEGHQHNAV